MDAAFGSFGVSGGSEVVPDQRDYRHGMCMSKEHGRRAHDRSTTSTTNVIKRTTIRQCELTAGHGKPQNDDIVIHKTGNPNIKSQVVTETHNLEHRVEREGGR